MSGRYTVLVTGSSGMLGIDLCRELAADYRVVGLDIRPSPPGHRPSAGFVRCEIMKRESVTKIFSKVRPHIVVHAAAYTDVDGCELDAKKAYIINSLGTENIALACKAVGAVLIYVSTDFVFNGHKRSPYTEKDRTDPISVYGDSKLEGERSVEKTLKEYFILRTSWLYGRHGKNFVDTILNKIGHENIIKVVDDQVGSPTYTKDLARAIHALVRRSLRTTHDAQRTTNYGIYHISNSGSVSWYNYAKAILKFAGSKAKTIPISSEELARPAERPAMSVLDNSKFRGFAHFRMRRWKDALSEYLNQLQEFS